MMPMTKMTQELKRLGPEEMTERTQELKRLKPERMMNITDGAMHPTFT